MHEIFISYSSKRRGLTRKLEKAIEARYGRDSVWCDNKLESWGSFEGHISAKTEAARAIVVIWNEDAATSESIKSEAHSALMQGRLVNVVLDSFPAGKIPMPYSIYQVQPLSDIESILENIAGVMAGKPLEIAIPEEEDHAGDANAPLPGAAPENIEAAASLKKDGTREGARAEIQIAGIGDGSAASFPRKREPISAVETSVHMEPRMRGDDAAVTNRGPFSLDDSGPLPSAVREKFETAAPLEDGRARDFNSPLAGSIWEKPEAGVALSGIDAGVRNNSLPSVAQERFETVPAFYEDSVFLYAAPLPGEMWEQPEANAPLKKAGARGEGSLPPRVEEAEPEAAARSKEDAGIYYAGPLRSVTEEKPEAIAPSKEEAAPDRGAALSSVAEEKAEAVAPSEEEAALDHGAALSSVAEEKAEAVAPSEEEAALDHGAALSSAVEEKAEAAAPSEEEAALKRGGALPRAVEEKPEVIAPSEEQAALDSNGALSSATQETLETAAPVEDDDAQEDGDPLLDAKQETLKSDPREILPSELLQARYAVVSFNDTAGARRDCLAWCRNAAQSAAGRLYHGPGGLGKTRLLIEVAAELREAGWTAGFLDRDWGGDEARSGQAWQALERRVLRGKDAGVLIVLDQAEARQAEVAKIARLLLQERANATQPLRLVLLSRSASPWWERLSEDHEEIARLFAGTPDALALNPMASAGARQALFKESVVRFWPVLQAHGFVRPAGAPPRERLERITKGDGFEHPLAIQMEALLYLCGTPPAAGDGIARQLDKVLELEFMRWEKLLGPLADGSREDLEHGAAQVAAVGGAPSDAAAEALLLSDEFHEDRRTGDADVGPALYNLACLYGRDDGSIAPIEPELLGEHHLAGTADAELIEGCLAWIDTQPEAEREARNRHLIATLQHAAGAGHGVKAGKATVVLDGLILNHMPPLAASFVAVLTGSPGPLKRRIEVLLGALDFEALRALDLALPKSHHGLLEFAHKVASRHSTQATAALSKLRSKGADASRLEFALKDIAEALSSAGSRLSALGKHDEALGSSLEAARIYRHLAKARFDSHAPDLAMSLRGLGQIHLSNGQNREAMAALEEALAAIAPFFEKTPQVFWRLVESLIGDYAVACSLAGADGNAALVDRIEAVIERIKAGDIVNSPVPEAERERFASIQALFEKAQATGTLSEELLAKLPPETAKQARTLWAALEGQKAVG